MEVEFSKLTSNKLKNRVYEEILKKIMSNQYNPGDKLFINDIAENLGVSNTPVREALEALKNDGLLVKQPYKSFTVKEHTIEEIKDIYELSASIESYTCKLAVERINEEELNDLIELHKKGKEFVDNCNTEKYKNYDKKFHFNLVKASKNDYLIDIYRNIRLELSLFAYQVLDTCERIKESYKNHAEIIDYLKNNKAEEARAHMEEHMLSSWQEFKHLQ